MARKRYIVTRYHADGSVKDIRGYTGDRKGHRRLGADFKVHDREFKAEIVLEKELAGALEAGLEASKVPESAYVEKGGK